MNMKPTCTEWSRRQLSDKQRSRHALTLLELVIASSMLAVVITSLSLVMRTARTTWEANDNDYAAMHHAHTVARHFVRQARQARRVTALPPAGDSITLEFPDGSQRTWNHVSGTQDFGDTVFLTLSSTAQRIPLATDIRDLSFTGFEANGITVAKDVGKIRLVEVRVTTVLPRGTNPQQSVASKVWIRSW